MVVKLGERTLDRSQESLNSGSEEPFNPLPHCCIDTGNSLVSESRFHYPLNEQVRLDKFKGAFQCCSRILR